MGQRNIEVESMLMKALEPLAALDRKALVGLPDDYIFYSAGEKSLTVGHVRAANEAMDTYKSLVSAESQAEAELAIEEESTVYCPSCGEIGDVHATGEPDEDGLVEYRCGACGEYWV